MPHGERNRQRTGPTRRDVLRTTAAATAGLGAFSGTGVAGRSRVQEIGGVSGLQVDAWLETAGYEVLRTLATEGLLGDASAVELPTTRSRGLGEIAANREGRATVRGTDGVLRHVTAKRLDDGVLRVTVEPERDRAYAFFEPADGGEKLIYDPQMDLHGVARSDVGTTDDCNENCNCTSILCDDNTCKYVEECEVCCCTASCGCCCNTDYTCCC